MTFTFNITILVYQNQEKKMKTPKWLQIDNYLFDAEQAFRNDSDITSIRTDNDSILVYYREKRLSSTWRRMMKIAKTFTKLHYVCAVYDNDPPKGYNTASALFQYKNKTRSLYFYIKNNLHKPKKRK